jgi:hypothetical protein
VAQAFLGRSGLLREVRGESSGIPHLKIGGVEHPAIGEGLEKNNARYARKERKGPGNNS